MTPYDELEKLQQHLDDLQADRAAMEIVFTSLKNAFLIHPHVEWEEVDKEICRAYDDLMAQVRHLDRSLKRLDKNIKSTEAKKLANINESLKQDGHDLLNKYFLPFSEMEGGF